MRTKAELAIADLPGADLIVKGLRDRRAGLETVESCLIAIAQPRLRQAGLLSDTPPPSPAEDAELTLYRLLRREPGDAYSRYNALLRRLVSFQRALGRISPLSRQQSL